MQKLQLQSFLGAAEVHVEAVDAIRDWKAMSLGWGLKPLWDVMRFEQAPITYSGGLRDDSTGNHGFIFLRKRGQTLKVEGE